MKTYRVGEFANIGGVTAKTLRYYDDVGILRPVTRDSRSGYRLYSAEQLSDLFLILNLRRFGLSIEEISAIRSRPASTPRLLDSLRAKTESEIDRAQSALALLDALERQPNSDLLAISTREHQPRLVATLRAKLGDYTDAVELERELTRSLPASLLTLHNGVLWHQCADSGSLEAEAFVSVTAFAQLPGKITLRHLPASRAATIYCSNAHEPAERAYDDLRAWMKIHRHTLAGPKIEMEHDNVLEIGFPYVAA
jgi:DNA-binding transcriptional MerR regulator